MYNNPMFNTVVEDEVRNFKTADVIHILMDFQWNQVFSHSNRINLFETLRIITLRLNNDEHVCNNEMRQHGFSLMYDKLFKEFEKAGSPIEKHSSDSFLRNSEYYYILGDFQYCNESIWGFATTILKEFIEMHQLNLEVNSHRQNREFVHSVSKKIGKHFEVLESAHKRFFEGTNDTSEVYDTIQEAKILRTMLSNFKFQRKSKTQVENEYYARRSKTSRKKEEDDDPVNFFPSKCLHVKNLKTCVTEADILKGLQQFGPISYVTCMNHSRMAFVEFEDIEAAKACVNFAQANQIHVGGEKISIEYSFWQHTKRGALESATPNKVLVLTVLNAQYPIDADVIYQICNPQGRVLRIAVMRKPTVVQALVEFDNADMAKSAKQAMNGTDIYSGCCTLKIEFAKTESVRVTRQDKYQRDYTLPSNRNSSRFDDYHDRGGRFDHERSLGGGQGCVLMIYGLDHDKVNCEMLFNILCQYGNVLRISFMRTKTETGMIEMGTPDERQNVLDHLQGFELFGLTFEFKPSHHECVHSMKDPFLLPDGSPSFRDFTSSINQRFSTPEFAAKNRIIYPTSVLHWFNAPGTMDKEALEKLLEEKSEHKATLIEVFPSRDERSAAGVAEFDSVVAANEVLALVNHTPVECPYGSAPFIVKWAYATPRRWDSNEKPRENQEKNLILER